MPVRPSLVNVGRDWGWIGCTGFGGPPAHIALLRQLCVERRGWFTAAEFEDAIAACNLLPGPASTQLAIFSAWRVAGPLGALVGGAAFITPGLVLILVLSVLFLAGSPPHAVLGAAAGMGAAVAAVAARAGSDLLRPSLARAPSRARFGLYAALGAVAAATLGPGLVLVLVGCGLLETLGLMLRSARRLGSYLGPLAVAVAGASGGGIALVWVALKIGALSYGGGFVIIPLMQGDAVRRYHWMTDGQFLNAVALGQVTPGPVVLTVSVVGFAAAGVGGGLLAALVAFTPSFVFVLVGARHFDRLRTSPLARAFLSGAGPAAIGAILGAAVPLALALGAGWQYAVLGGAATALLVLRRGVVTTLVAAALVGLIAVQFGAPAS